MYPKWKYHAKEEAKIFYSAEEELEAGDGWKESPADTKEPESPADTKEPEITKKKGK